MSIIVKQLPNKKATYIPYPSPFPSPNTAPIKPDDKEMMDFVDLDNILISKDELNRAKLAGKRKEFLKTDLTWKQVLFENDVKKRFAGKMDMLVGIAKTLGYEYVCSEGKVYQIVPSETRILPSGETYWIAQDIGLEESDINEIL